MKPIKNLNEWKIHPDNLLKNTHTLGFKAICGNCGHIADIEYFGFDEWNYHPIILTGDSFYRGLRIEKPDGISWDDRGEYLHITCPNCTYRHKID